jgi:serine/threonine protein phosphatase PrpC
MELSVTDSLIGVDVAFRSEVGRARRHNEDFVSYYEPDDPQELALSGRLYVVADVVGGAAAGEVASQYAVRKVLAEYYAFDETDLEERLVQAVMAANVDIHHFADRHPRPMATTVVAAVVHQDELIIANVGDSRAYLMRGDEIRQVTEDHSLVAQMVRRGRISPEEAEDHPGRNLLVRTVGGSDKVQVDIFGGPLLLDDVVVLCTDGLTRYVSEEEIARVVRTLRPQQAVDELVGLANGRGGKDNITALVLQMVEPDDDMDTEPRARPIETPDLQELERTVVARRAPVRRMEWPSLAIGAVVALVVGLALLVLGGLGGGGGGETAPASTQTVGAGAGGPTQTPGRMFIPEVTVYFAEPAGVHREPSPQSDEVFVAADGQSAQVLGGPTWGGSGAVWWLLRLTRDDGQTVTGWAMQAVLDETP